MWEQLHCIERTCQFSFITLPALPQNDQKGPIGTPNRGGPQRAHTGRRAYTGRPGGPSPNFPKLGKVEGNHFLKGFGGKLAFPKASWVPYNPFRSREIPYSQFSKPFLHKTMFSGTLDVLQTSPRPSREPDLGSWIRFGIPGPKNGPWGQKRKRCAPKNHAEPRLQNSKWSHMVQVMAKNHFGPHVGPTWALPGTHWEFSHLAMPAH